MKRFHRRMNLARVCALASLMTLPMAASAAEAPAQPLFAAQAAADRLFPVTGMDLLHSWQKAGQRFELHLYEKGGHGFGLRNLRGETSDAWMDAYLAWLQRQ